MKSLGKQQETSSDVARPRLVLDTLTTERQRGSELLANSGEGAEDGYETPRAKRKRQNRLASQRYRERRKQNLQAASQNSKESFSSPNAPVSPQTSKSHCELSDTELKCATILGNRGSKRVQATKRPRSGYVQVAPEVYGAEVVFGNIPCESKKSSECKSECPKRRRKSTRGKAQQCSPQQTYVHTAETGRMDMELTKPFPAEVMDSNIDMISESNFVLEENLTMQEASWRTCGQSLSHAPSFGKELWQGIPCREPWQNSIAHGSDVEDSVLLSMLVLGSPSPSFSDSESYNSMGLETTECGLLDINSAESRLLVGPDLINDSTLTTTGSLDDVRLVDIGCYLNDADT